MSKLTKRIEVIFALLTFLLQAAHASDRWQTIPLMTNKFLFARLQVLRTASAADENWMVLEIKNLSGNPLSIQQTWFGLDAERRDPLTDKLICSGSLGPGTVFGGVITSGVVRVTSNIWPWLSTTLRRPPQSGIKVVANLRLGFMTGSGNFDSPTSIFTFNWTYPDAKGIASMKKRLKPLLKNPQYKFEHGLQLETLFAFPEVADDLTASELLDALKIRQNSVDGRSCIANELGRRFAGDPNVVAYIGDNLRDGRFDDVIGGQGIWNPVFIPILVDRLERTGDRNAFEYVMGPHRGDWFTNAEIVTRISAALLKHRPFLTTNVSQLATNELFRWAECAHEAALTGDTSLIKMLARSLDDQRIVIHPEELRMANRPSRLRVCDHALVAVASIMEIPIYKEFGLWRKSNGLAEAGDWDRAITDIKKHIAAFDSKR